MPLILAEETRIIFFEDVLLPAHGKSLMFEFLVDRTMIVLCEGVLEKITKYCNL